MVRREDVMEKGFINKEAAQVMRLAMHYNIDLEKAFVEAREDEDRYLKSRGV